MTHKQQKVKRKPRNKHEQLQRALDARCRLSTIFSPGHTVSHASDGRAYRRHADGSIRRVPEQDGKPNWLKRARTIRDFVVGFQKHEKRGVA